MRLELTEEEAILVLKYLQRGILPSLIDYGRDENERLKNTRIITRIATRLDRVIRKRA